MKKLIVLTIALGLVAGAAFAGVPDGALRTINKIPPVKNSAVDGKVGLLDCSGAIEIALDNTYTGDSTGAPNNVTTYGCSSWDESGGEVVYHLFLAEAAMWEATLTASGCDLDLVVLDQCDENLGCLIVADSGVVTNTAVSGDFYFVVDGYSGAACPFTFEIATVTPPPPVEFCSSVEDVFGTTFTGTTCTGVNLIESYECGTYTEAGLEYYYEIFMPSGSSFTADVTNTADGALWVMDACADPINCLAYADGTLAGAVETVSYANTTASDMYVYLVIDSYGTDSCGDYEMTFTSTGGSVAVEQAAFGAVKALYR